MPESIDPVYLDPIVPINDPPIPVPVVYPPEAGAKVEADGNKSRVGTRAIIFYFIQIG